MKRTCRSGIIDFDAMNAFAPDNKSPFCQVAASGYGDAGLQPGTFLQTDDMGQVMHRDLAFKMLLDLCIRTGTDSARYLYSEFVRSMDRDGFKPGLSIPEPGTLVRRLLDGFGVSGICMPDIPCALERNFSVFHDHDMMGELRQRSSGDKQVRDIVDVLDWYVYIEPGKGSFDKAMDAVAELMTGMQADEIRLLTGLFYKAMARVPVQPFSMASVRPLALTAVKYVMPATEPAEPENDGGNSAEDDGYGYEPWTEEESHADATSGVDGPQGGPVDEDQDYGLADAVSDEAEDGYTEAPTSEDGVDSGHDDSDHASADGWQDESDAESETEPEDVTPDVSGFESETDPDDHVGGADTAAGDGGSDAWSESESGTEAEIETETETETEADPETDPETEAETEPPVPMSPGVVPLSVSDLIGKDASYASGYLSEQYDRELEAAPSDGLLEAMVASRANGTASPIDVLSETIHKVAETPSIGRNLREDMRDMAKAARDAAPGADLGAGSPESRQ